MADATDRMELCHIECSTNMPSPMVVSDGNCWERAELISSAMQMSSFASGVVQKVAPHTMMPLDAKADPDARYG